MLRNGVRSIIIVAALLAPLAVFAASSPQTALRIAHTGAANLALRQISAGEAAVRDNPSAWAQWERARIEVYQLLGDWQAVIDRVAELPSSSPAAFHAWALIQAAEAELALGDGAAARRALRERLKLSTQADNTPAGRQAGWLMIRSFVIDGNLDQALSMIRARRAQYPEAVDPRLDRLQARIAILTHDPARAFALLANTKDSRALPLKWLAGLRVGKLQPAAVEQSAEAFVAAGQPPASRRAALIVAAEAALDRGDGAGRIARLEQAITISTTASNRQPPFALNVDDIWQSLVGLGQVLGHQLGLAGGDGSAWLAAAAQAQQPVEAQALLAAPAFRAEDSDIRTQAHARLADLIVDEPNGDELLRQLYLHSKRFRSLAAMPAPVRYRLADVAIHGGDMILAARLLATLDQPPSGVDAQDWRLERARAFILAGNADAGVAAIDALLASGAAFPFDELQPSLFALQATGRHRDAIRFFRQLLSRQPPPKVRQKLLYWLGDSYAASGKPATAATLYLQSATAINATAMSRWARSARYQAAGALASAGLVDDARRVYQRLLNAAGDPARRGALRQKIDALPVPAAD